MNGLAELSEEDRGRLIRGEGLPPRRRYRRLVTGVSQQAHGIWTLLDRSETGARSMVSLTNTGAWLGAALAELVGLGLVEQVGAGAGAVVRLLPAAEGVALVSGWSMG